MDSLDRLGWAVGTVVSLYGLRIGLRANSEAALARMAALLPPGWSFAAEPEVDRLYSLLMPEGPARPGLRRFHLAYADAARVARTLEPEEAVAALEQDLHAYLAEYAGDRVFVHAGVVGWQGGAIVVPGRTHTGKSTLVAALLRAGAAYYSDEYAVLDSTGLVHPFPRPLSLRGQDGVQAARCSPGSFGAGTGVDALPVVLVLVTYFRADARFGPRALSPGKAMLELLGNTVAARRSPEPALRALRLVTMKARLLKGVRGDADTVAARILSRAAR